MSLQTEQFLLAPLIGRMSDALSLMVASNKGADGATLRFSIGKLRANGMSWLQTNVFAANLFDIFMQALAVPVSLLSVDQTRLKLMEERPTGPLAAALVNGSLLFCLTVESRLIVKINFVSRDDVDVMVRKMKAAFDIAREIAADTMDSATYQALTSLAGALIQHLSATARPLPRMVNFDLSKSYTALALANFIYQDPNRWEELIAENKPIHPAFMQRSIVGLSA